MPIQRREKSASVLSACKSSGTGTRVMRASITTLASQWYWADSKLASLTKPRRVRCKTTLLPLVAGRSKTTWPSWTQNMWLGRWPV